MKNKITFKNEVELKIERKCKEYDLNSELFKVEMVYNMIIITIPTSYPFIGYVWFKGEKRNYPTVMLNVERYLNEVIPQVFVSEKLPEKEYLCEFNLDEYDQDDG